MDLPRRKPIYVFLDNYSKSSRRTVLSAMNNVASILSDGEADATTLNWESVKYEHYAALRSTLEESYKPKTGNRILSFIKVMTRVLESMGLVTASHVLSIQNIRAFDDNGELAGRMLEPDEIELLIQAPLADGYGLKGIRDHAILLTLLTSGVRRSELVRLRVRDFDFEKQSINVIYGKNNNSRTIYIPERTVDALNDWLKVSNIDHPDMYIFCSFRKGDNPCIGHGMHGNAIWELVNEYTEKAGLDTLTPHDLRRTYISLLIDKGVDIITVSKMAGHSNIGQTAAYDRRGETAKQNAAKAFQDILNGDSY